MTRIACVLALSLFACAGERWTSAYAIGDYRGNVLAADRLCENAVARYERNAAFETTEPALGPGRLSDSELDRLHRDRMQRCTAALSQREAVCIAGASDLRRTRQCAGAGEMR